MHLLDFSASLLEYSLADEKVDEGQVFGRETDTARERVRAKEANDTYTKQAALVGADGLDQLLEPKEPTATHQVPEHWLRSCTGLPWPAYKLHEAISRREAAPS